MKKRSKPLKKNTIFNGKSVQDDTGKIVTAPLRARRVKDMRSARSLMSQIIYRFQKEEIPENRARCLAYLLIQYSNLYKVELLDSLEKRLSEIEEGMSHAN